MLMTTNLLIANSIYIFHILVILFVIFIPFSNIPAFLILHITFCLCLFVHWYANSNICSLTIIEGKFRGLDRTQTFSHKFIAPLYDISESEWNTYIWIITIILMFISIYKLYHTQKVQIAWSSYKNLKNKNISTVFKCIQPLFEI